jgi:hypothetical protein
MADRPSETQMETHRADGLNELLTLLRKSAQTLRLLPGYSGATASSLWKRLPFGATRRVSCVSAIFADHSWCGLNKYPFADPAPISDRGK